MPCKCDVCRLLLVIVLFFVVVVVVVVAAAVTVVVVAATVVVFVVACLAKPSHENQPYLQTLVMIAPCQDQGTPETLPLNLVGVMIVELTVLTTIKKGCWLLFCRCFNGCLLLFPFCFNGCCCVVVSMVVSMVLCCCFNGCLLLFQW